MNNLEVLFMDKDDSWISGFGVDVNYKISFVTYSYKGYLFDIGFDLGKFEFSYWLYHPSCGIKSFMHGCSMNDCSYNEFLLTVFSGLDDDIKFYDEEYNY